MQKKILFRSFAIKGSKEMGEVLGRECGCERGLFVIIVCFLKMEL